VTLQTKRDGFKADFEAGKPPYNVRPSVVETMHCATVDLIASGAATALDAVVAAGGMPRPSGEGFSRSPTRREPGARREMKLHAAFAASLRYTRGGFSETDAAWTKVLEIAESLEL
jgi:hypothetical protein